MLKIHSFKMTTYKIEDYDEAKLKMEELLRSEDYPIILLGNGKNGKTHLVKEMQTLGVMNSNWTWNPEYFPETCIVDNNGFSTHQPQRHYVYELRNFDQLSYINVPYSVIDMNPVHFD